MSSDLEQFLSLPGALFSPVGNGSAYHSGGLEKLHGASEQRLQGGEQIMGQRRQERVAGSQGQVLWQRDGPFAYCRPWEASWGFRG